MDFLFKWSVFTWSVFILAISSCLEAKPHARIAGASSSQVLQDARTYSFLIRDHGPKPEEINALLQGTVSLEDLQKEWLASAAHRDRMLRYFDDMMGYREALIILGPNARLNKTPDGVYFSPKKGGCASTEAVSAEAWWLPEGVQARFCPNLLPTELTPEVGSKTLDCTKAGRNGFLNPACGCGPDRIQCIAGEEANRLLQEVQREFAERALQVYEKNQSWLDLLAAPEFYGTRRLYWLYLQNQSQFAPAAFQEETLRTLRSLPLDKPEVRPYPAGAERSGIATAPGFLVQYNNFRSRIAGLTRSFLCQDMNPTLNTDGIQTFVNPSLKPTDRAHGEKADCSSCHYALDNLGGAVMPWTDRGVYQPRISSRTHAFGETGEGPAFLMRSFVERGPGFEDCMARRAWEDFSGQSWAQTDEAIKSTVRNWVAEGPGPLIHTLIASEELKQALAGNAGNGPTPDLSSEDWASMRPILQQSCSGASCHSTGSRQPAYADVSRLWITDRDKLKDRLQRTDSGQMPPRSRSLTDDDRAFLLQKILSQ